MMNTDKDYTIWCRHFKAGEEFTLEDGSILRVEKISKRNNKVKVVILRPVNNLAGCQVDDTEELGDECIRKYS